MFIFDNKDNVKILISESTVDRSKPISNVHSNTNTLCFGFTFKIVKCFLPPFTYVYCLYEHIVPQRILATEIFILTSNAKTCGLNLVANKAVGGKDHLCEILCVKAVKSCNSQILIQIFVCNALK